MSADLTNLIYRPILFSGAMVKAILAGRKTQTRRVVKPRIGGLAGMGFWGYDHDDNDDTPFACFGTDMCGMVHRLRCPYGVPGDRLWVRETWLYVGPGSGSDLPDYVEERKNPAHHITRNCWYRADGERPGIGWTPSIHMPRWASRLTLEITGVRVERVQDIGEADAQREGWDYSNVDVYATYDPVTMDSARQWFRGLWDSINGPRGYGWDANPWVWVVEFKRIGS